MLGMMEEFGNDLADNLLKHDNKGMNYPTSERCTEYVYIFSK